MTALTPRQVAAIEAIRESMTDRGYPPSLRELGAAIGLTSTSSVLPLAAGAPGGRG